jgi:hypothetical protein
MHTREPENKPKDVDASKGFEASDVRVSGVVVFLIGLTVFGVIAAVIAYGFGAWMNARMVKQDGPVNRWAHPVDMRTLGNLPSTEAMKNKMDESIQSFPAPRLQVDDGLQDLAELHAREDLLLDNYSWLGQSQDASQGKVRIPIERAMELIAQRGLPVTPPMEETPLLTGDEKPLVVVPLTNGFARTGYELDQAAEAGRRLQ